MIIDADEAQVLATGSEEEITRVLISYGAPYCRALRAARQARFEYGKTPCPTTT